MSAGIFLPLRKIVIAPSGRASTEATVSPKRNVTARSRRWYFSASTTSRSQKSSILSRRSTTVTFVPSVANIEAYSIPITPAPTTTIDRGTRSRWMIPSESMIVLSSKSTLDGLAGIVPVAMTILSALTLRVRAPPSATSTSLGPMNWAVPGMMVTRLRTSWLRTVSFSRVTTWLVRAVRSEMVISSFTR